MKPVLSNWDTDSGFHTSQLTANLKAAPAPHIYSPINPEPLASTQHRGWSGQGAQHLLLGSHPSSMVAPAWDGAFSWPGRKCLGLKDSLGRNLRSFSNLSSASAPPLGATFCLAQGGEGSKWRPEGELPRVPWCATASTRWQWTWITGFCKQRHFIKSLP